MTNTQEKEILYQKLAARIRTLCKERHITINALSAKAGLWQSSIDNIMRGASKSPGIWLIARIASGFDMTLSEFLEGIDEHPVQDNGSAG